MTAYSRVETTELEAVDLSHGYVDWDTAIEEFLSMDTMSGKDKAGRYWRRTSSPITG